MQHKQDDVVTVNRNGVGGPTQVVAGPLVVDLEGDGPFEVPYHIFERFLADTFSIKGE